MGPRCRAELSSRVLSSRTRRIQPRRRETLTRAVSGPNGPVFGPKNLNFLPLHFDASNPSSNVGWYQRERKGFIERAKFDAIIALAFEHHLAIAKNVPLDDVISWLVSLAPTGLIEFVPKEDETIKKMLEFKGDIFPKYTKENFEKYLSKNSEIISKYVVSKSGRTIYEYKN